MPELNLSNEQLEDLPADERMCAAISRAGADMESDEREALLTASII